MNKKDAKEIARNMIQDAIGKAYYELYENTNYSDNEKDMINKYLYSESERMLKVIKREYIAY